MRPSQEGVLKSPPLSRFSALVLFTGFVSQRPDRQLHVLWYARQQPAFVPRDGVSGHAELLRQFALSETEEEPLSSKLPTGQSAGRLPQGAFGVNSYETRLQPEIGLWSPTGLNLIADSA